MTWSVTLKFLLSLEGVPLVVPVGRWTLLVYWWLLVAPLALFWLRSSSLLLRVEGFGLVVLSHSCLSLLVDSTLAQDLVLSSCTLEALWSTYKGNSWWLLVGGFLLLGASWLLLLWLGVGHSVTLPCLNSN